MTGKSKQWIAHKEVTAIPSLSRTFLTKDCKSEYPCKQKRKVKPSQKTKSLIEMIYYNGRYNISFYQNNKFKLTLLR